MTSEIIKSTRDAKDGKIVKITIKVNEIKTILKDNARELQNLMLKANNAEREAEEVKAELSEHRRESRK